MTEILFSEGEKESLCMGDIALDRAEYERKIQGLEDRLREINRHHEAADHEKQKAHDKEVENARSEHRGSFDKIQQLEHEVSRLRKVVSTETKNLKERAMKTEYYKVVDEKLKEMDETDNGRLITALENTRMMLLLLHEWGVGGSNVEQNNLICAMREFGKAKLGFDYDDHKKPEWGAMRELIAEHIRKIFQPHKTVVGAWTKDADPSLHPFRPFVEVEEEKLEKIEKELTELQKISKPLFSKKRPLDDPPIKEVYDKLVKPKPTSSEQLVELRALAEYFEEARRDAKKSQYLEKKYSEYANPGKYGF